MIGIKLEGRLGNQLFQYAFIYSVAKKLKTRFYVDKSLVDFIVPKYFDIKPDRLYLADRIIRIYKKISRSDSKPAFYSFLRKTFGLKELVFDNSLPAAAQLKNIDHKTLYSGFFQSVDYFIDHKTEVINLFSIKKRYKNQFEKIVKTLPPATKYVTVHVRRGDYLALDISLNADYYHKAIKSIHTDENYYIFISDDFEYITKEFAYLDKKYLSKHREIVDLQFLSYADICILSNSSFSWWGAYLNPKNPVVIAPKYWLGQAQQQEYPVGVIPGYWQQL